jgi:SulP family sulfate permease
VNREFIGQGLATIAGGFTQCLPASGSPSRSAILVRGGAQTRLAAVLSGLFMWGLLVLFIGLIERIPIAALAAVVIISAIGLINPTQIRFTWRAQTSSRVVMLATFAAALLLPLQYAIYAGVLLSILIYLQESTRLRLTLLEFTDDGQIMERPIAGLLDGRPEVAVLNIEGALYFGAAEQMDKIAHDCLKGGVRVLVLRLRSARNLASTGAAALVGAIRAFQQNGGVVFLSGIDGPTRRTLEAAGITALVGDDHIFEGSEALYAATRRALEAARRHTTREV